MDLNEILKSHKLWIDNGADGLRADLSGANLRYANLSNADLSSANLRYANLSSANLSSANLSNANLSSANLSNANLIDANLSSANLCSANLSNAKLDYRIISITGIGSANRMTTYDTRHNRIWCGCFTGTLEEFEAQVIETHTGNDKFRNEYINAIKYFKTFLGGNND